MYTGFIMLFSAVLAVLSIVSIVKNSLISFNVSDNGWKTILIVILGVVCLLCAAISYSDAYTIRDIMVMQLSTEMSQEKIDELNSLIHIKTIIITVFICIGYIAYLLHILLIMNVRKNKLKEIEAGTNRRWKHI